MKQIYFTPYYDLNTKHAVKANFRDIIVLDKEHSWLFQESQFKTQYTLNKSVIIDILINLLILVTIHRFTGRC